MSRTHVTVQSSPWIQLLALCSRMIYIEQFRLSRSTYQGVGLNPLVNKKEFISSAVAQKKQTVFPLCVVSLLAFSSQSHTSSCTPRGANTRGVAAIAAPTPASFKNLRRVIIVILLSSTVSISPNSFLAHSPRRQ